MKLTKEMIDKVRHIEGFPLGSDEDIIALSQPPYYTACPNPFIEDFIKEHGKPYNEENDKYFCEPFATDVTEGKNDPVYNAHTYHTKVPYKAIMNYILHYTEPGDIILDGFSGSGMTGVAAHLCGYENVKYSNNLNTGIRYSVLNDLSPAAALISSIYCGYYDLEDLQLEIQKVRNMCFEKFGWLYSTTHVDRLGNAISDLTGSSIGEINYVVWSDVLICPSCSSDIVFWDVAVDSQTKKVKDEFTCKTCNTKLDKKSCMNSRTIVYDEALGKQIEINKSLPVEIHYKVNGKRYTRDIRSEDFEYLEKIEKHRLSSWFPKDRMIEGKESRRNDKNGLTHVHHFFTKRNLIAMSSYLEIIRFSKPEYQNILRFILQSFIFHLSKLNRKVPGGIGRHLSGTLYLPSLSCEVSFFELFDRKIDDILESLSITNQNKNSTIISQGSTTSLENIPSNSIDYIFTDPPFGDNLSYSELSFIWEAWLNIKTNYTTEAVMNTSHGKSIVEYQSLMTKCISEYFRVLKPSRWITVEFHNSKNSVWMAIQESIQKAGFVIADVRILNKKQESFKQVNSQGAVKQDLVISAYKPKESFRKELISHHGTVQTAWDFVRQHLEKLPVVVQKGNKIEIIVERQDFLLFDRMIAFHIVNSISVPLDAADFYKGLDEKFIKRDNMYFLHDQVNEYDNARIQNDVEDIQFSLFVSNEKTAIAWLYQQLAIPQTYSMIQPKFMQEIRSVDKYEKLPELLELLEENFLKENNGEWYIPDINKATDVIRLREKKLVKEFEEYLSTSGKLKKFRTEAVRAGFAKLWKDKNFDLIVKTAERLPEEVVQEDEKLLMYYDLSLSRLG